MADWANFAKNGDPNGKGLLPWPAYTTEHKQRIHVDTPISVQQLSEKEIERFDVLNQYGLHGLNAYKKE